MNCIVPFFRNTCFHINKLFIKPVYVLSGNETRYLSLKTKMLIYWFKLSRSALILECLLFGLKNRGLLILLFPDVWPASVAGIF